VNVASNCGFTPQYTDLETIYKKYKDRGFVLLAFPCNQFGGQEPGTDKEIQNFCLTNFQTSFPLMQKIDVNGDNAHPVYEYIKSKKSSLMMSRIKWNFEKFLIDKNGNVVDRYSSITTPSDISSDIEKCLK